MALPLKKRTHLLFLLLFPLAVFAIYTSSPNRLLGDSLWAVHISMSIINEGNTDLNEYCGDNCANDYRLFEHQGKYYSYFPDATSILSVPLVFLLEKTSGLLWGYRLSDHIKNKIHWSENAQCFISSLYLCVATALFIVLLYSQASDMKAVVICALLFAFGTSNYSVVSRVLWAHSLSIVCNTWSLLLLFKNSPRSLALTALPLTCAYFIRPTNAIPLAVYGIFILLQDRRTFLSYCIIALVTALPFVIYNEAVYGSLLTPYFYGGRLSYHDNFFEALAGNLFSTARGIFVFSPLLLFSIHGFIITLKQPDTLKALVLLVIPAIHWLGISLFPHWWAGHSFGPRLFSDMTPYFTLLTFFSVQQIFSQTSQHQKMLSKGLVMLLLGISIAIHSRGATLNAAWKWNISPDIETHQERLWSISCPQFFCSEEVLERSTARQGPAPESKQ